MKRSDLVSVIVVLALCLLLAFVFMKGRARLEEKSQRLVCVNNLKEIGISFRMWPRDDNRSPMIVSERFGGAQESAESGGVWRVFQVMSNFVAEPKRLICPEDTRRPADSWSQLSSNAQVSYFVGLEAEDFSPNMLLSGDRNIALNGKLLAGVVALGTNSPVQWTANDIHRGEGNIGYADGSVQQFTTKKLRAALVNSGDSTNRLVFP